MPSKSRHRRLPVVSLLIAAALWGVIWYPLRLLQVAGLPGLWTTLIGYSAALATGVVLFRRQLAELSTEPFWFGLLGLAMGWCNVAFILAVLDGFVVRVMLLFYLSPLWTVILGRVVLGERVRPTAIWVLASAMAGAVAMLWDPALGWPWPRGPADWLALSAGLAFAVSNIAVRKMQSVSLRSKALATWIGVVLVAGVGASLSGQPAPGLFGDALWGALALGVCGFLIMTLAVQYGVTYLPVQRSAIILLFELVVGAVSAALLAGETMDRLEWLGGSLIILAALLAAREPQSEDHD